MKNAVQAEGHVPYRFLGVLGCNGYKNTDKVICMTASGDNNVRTEGKCPVTEQLKILAKCDIIRKIIL